MIPRPVAVFISIAALAAACSGSTDRRGSAGSGGAAGSGGTVSSAGSGGAVSSAGGGAGGSGGTGAAGSPAAGEGGAGAPGGSGGTTSGAGAGGAVDCNCARGGYAPVCGVDGHTHDAICGVECVPVDIACNGECPCQSTACPDDCASQGLACCNGTCVNTGNDRSNCGSCGAQCSAATPYCNMGTCEAPPCDPATTCLAGTECCGTSCCEPGQICCFLMQGAWFTGCVDPVEGTCPVGCPNCDCADPDTPVATPEGERRIAEIEVGDLVYSVDRDGIVVVPVIETRRTPVFDHAVVRVTLETGRALEVSANHPTAEGGDFGGLSAGRALDGVLITEVEIIPYEHEFTYDILPGSTTGHYFAAGIAIGSTLKPPGR